MLVDDAGIKINIDYKFELFGITVLSEINA